MLLKQKCSGWPLPFERRFPFLSNANINLLKANLPWSSESRGLFSRLGEGVMSRGAFWQVHISTKDWGGGGHGATPLAYLTSWWEGRGGGGLLCGYSGNWRLHEQDIERRSEPSQPPASDVCQSRRYIFYYIHNDWCFSAALRDEWC